MLETTSTETEVKRYDDYLNELNSMSPDEIYKRLLAQLNMLQDAADALKTTIDNNTEQLHKEISKSSAVEISTFNKLNYNKVREFIDDLEKVLMRYISNKEQYLKTNKTLLTLKIKFNPNDNIFWFEES